MAEERRKRNGGETCILIILLVLCLFLPPLAVLISRGCTKDFALNLLLTLLIWIPGVIHAFYLVGTGEERKLHEKRDAPTPSQTESQPVIDTQGPQGGSNADAAAQEDKKKETEEEKKEQVVKANDA